MDEKKTYELSKILFNYCLEESKIINNKIINVIDDNSIQGYTIEKLKDQSLDYVKIAYNISSSIEREESHFMNTEKKKY